MTEKGPRASRWPHPIAVVAVIQVVAMAVLGPLEAWIERRLPGRAWGVGLEVAFAAAVAILFVRGGWWRRAGRPSRMGLRLAATVAAAAAAYLVLRVRSWHALSAPDVAAAALGAFGVAVTEELIWRGFVLGTLEPRFGRLRAVVASSLLFGVAHLVGLFGDASLGWAAFRVLWATCLGVLFAGLLRVSGTYWAPILVHALFNGVGALDRASHTHVFAGVGASLDMLVAAPLFVVAGAFLCFEGLRTLPRVLAAGVISAGVVIVAFSVSARDPWPKPVPEATSPILPRVIGLEPTDNPRVMRLRFVVPAAWGGHSVRGTCVSSVNRGGGTQRMSLQPPERPRVNRGGEDLASVEIDFPESGTWSVEVSYERTVLWEKTFEVR